MTALDHPTTYAGVATMRTDVPSRMVKVFKAILRAIFNRRHLDGLNELSDHQLADIGLIRADLHEARLTHLAVDPTATLRAVSRQRHDEQLAHRIC